MCLGDGNCSLPMQMLVINVDFLGECLKKTFLVLNIIQNYIVNVQKWENIQLEKLDYL